MDVDPIFAFPVSNSRLIASGSETDIVAGQEESKTEVKDPEHPLIPDPSPALNHMPTVNLDRVSSSVEETEHVWHAFTRHDADFRGTLQAEKCIMRLEYCSFFDMLTGAVLQGTLVMTNYQIFFEPYDEAHLKLGLTLDYIAVPLGTIERIEKFGNESCVAQSCLDITTKDLRIRRFGFLPKQQKRDKTFECLRDKAYDCLIPFAFPTKIQYVFAFDHRKSISIPPAVDGWNVYNPLSEFFRMGLPNASFRLTEVNIRWALCDSYPRILVVPKATSDTDLLKDGFDATKKNFECSGRHVANFRSRGRLPVLTWKHPASNACLFRSSQPRVGISQARCQEDEMMLKTIGELNLDNPTLFIFDARPKINAVVNQVVGGNGFENTDTYSNCTITFSDIQNIHVMRESYQKFAKLVQRPNGNQFDNTWLSDLQDTDWLFHIRELLRVTHTMVSKIDLDHASILSHCSDGWDRTIQLCSLTELCLDPFYRTIRGFSVLVEKEWLSFGHKFQDRHGHADQNYADQERSPIFLQWLDAVFQLMHQFPCAFEFTPVLLLALSDHQSSCRYGTFLCNTPKERLELKLFSSTASVWTMVLGDASSFLNVSHRPEFYEDRPLYPNYSAKKVVVWEDFWYRYLPHESCSYALPSGIHPSSMCPMTSPLLNQARVMSTKISAVEDEVAAQSGDPLPMAAHLPPPCESKESSEHEPRMSLFRLPSRNRGECFSE